MGEQTVDSVVDEIRRACAWVAGRATHVRIREERIGAYAEALAGSAESRHGEGSAGSASAKRQGAGGGAQAPPPAPLAARTRAHECAFWLTLDAINFGSGWFPTLRKRPGHSGYRTIEAGLRERFEHAGPWTAGELAVLDAGELAASFGQDPRHELMKLFAASLNDVGEHLLGGYGGSFAGPLEQAGDSAVALVQTLAGWRCFADASRYEGRTIPFLKRAQIAAADLHRAGVASFTDVARLTMFADNLVPHVLRLDGVLEFDAALVARIERGGLIAHGSAEEVEIRACAVHAVELLAATSPVPSTAAELDQILWDRGALTRYKAVPRHRCRCTAY